MTAYETLSQQVAQRASMTQPSLVTDTYTVRWVASSNPMEHHPYVPRPRNDSTRGFYEPTSMYAAQNDEYAQQTQHRIYTNDGYFDSGVKPLYHYDSPWKREDAQHKQQESPVWSTKSLWIPQASVGSPSPLNQWDSSGNPVTSTLPHGHGRYSVPNSPNHTSSSPVEPIRALNDIDSQPHYTHLNTYVAHQPVPLSQQSAYSELSVNLKFMERLEREAHEATASAASRRRQSLPVISTSALSPVEVAPSSPTSVPSSTPSSRKHARQLSPSPTRSERKVPVKVSTTTTYRGVHISADAPSSPDLWIPTKLTFVDSTGHAPSPPADAPSSNLVLSMRNTKEPKKPSLACTFCRERKIACGRPPEGSADPTCNQCARRSFVCKYVNEHPRNPRRSRKH